MPGMHFPYLLTLSLALTVSFAFADQPSADNRSAAIDFKIGGVGINSTLDKLHELLPEAIQGRPSRAGAMRDDHIVVLNNGTNQVPTAFFRFLDKAVISIEIQYPSLCVNEIAAEKPMIDQFVSRFGKYDRTWRDDKLDGGVNIYVWESPTRFVSYSLQDDGTAHLYISRKPSDVLYPPKTPKTSILGIDPLANAASGR